MSQYFAYVMWAAALKAFQWRERFARVPAQPEDKHFRRYAADGGRGRPPH